MFLAVTNRDIRLYDLVPWTKEAWAVPVHTFPLIHTRLAHNSPSPVGLTSSSKSSHSGGYAVPFSNDTITFILRLGTRHGIDQRIMKVETHTDLANWARYFVQGAHLAAIALQEICFGE